VREYRILAMDDNKLKKKMKVKSPRLLRVVKIQVCITIIHKKVWYVENIER
jgi:hypothetical protein